ncbi:MAG: hypothetical protein LAP87_18655, partial [Acidobacteriia bacterium]|nr:hypothetical protein [Terriglobia bacterium]
MSRLSRTGRSVLGRRLRMPAILCLCSVSAFAAQSLILTGRTGVVTVPNDPSYQGSSYIDLRIHGWALPATCQNIFVPLTLLQLRLCPGGSAGPLQFDDYTDKVKDNGVFINPANTADLLIRVHRDLAAMQLVIEIWNANGTGYASAASPILSVGVFHLPSEAQIGDAGLSLNLAFLRWYSGVIPTGAAPPLGAPGGDLADWEFESDANDQSGHQLTFDLTPPVSRPSRRFPGLKNTSFTTTPAYPPACNAGASQTFRAGTPAMLDGTRSFPLDGSGTLTYSWAQVASTVDLPLQTVTWSSTTSEKPVVTGLAAGPFDVQLTVTDGSGQSASCTVHHSVVGTDDLGRVTGIPAGIDTILGPMTAMGVNPWPWADTAQIAWAQRYGGWQGTIPAPGGTFVDNWRTPDPPATPGTISVTNGSGTVTGS